MTLSDEILKERFYLLTWIALDYALRTVHDTKAIFWFNQDLTKIHALLVSSVICVEKPYLIRLYCTVFMLLKHYKFQKAYYLTICISKLLSKGLTFPTRANISPPPPQKKKKSLKTYQKLVSFAELVNLPWKESFWATCWNS